jgi:hypothetical protein
VYCWPTSSQLKAFWLDANIYENWAIEPSQIKQVV